MDLGKFALAILLLSAVIFVYRRQPDLAASFGELNATILSNETKDVFGTPLSRDYYAYEFQRSYYGGSPYYAAPNQYQNQPYPSN